MSPKLGFAGEGLKGKGPTPRGDFSSLQRLSKAVEQLRENKGVGGDNKLKISVRINWVRVDEADQGYYMDESVDPEKFRQVRSQFESQVPQINNENSEIASPLSPGRE